MQAAEETAKANAFLASLPQADPTESNLGKGLQGFFAAAAKVQLVAEPKTSLLVMQQVGRYGEIFIGLLARAQPLHDARTEINVNDSLYSTAQAEIARVLADMTKLRESAKPDLEIAAALRQTFEFQQAQAATFRNDVRLLGRSSIAQTPPTYACCLPTFAHLLTVKYSYRWKSAAIWVLLLTSQHSSMKWRPNGRRCSRS